MHLGFVSITYGKTCGRGNDCHEGRSLYSHRFLEAGDRACVQGYMEKHQSQSGGSGSEGRTGVRAIILISGKEQARQGKQDWLVWIILVGPGT